MWQESFRQILHYVPMRVHGNPQDRHYTMLLDNLGKMNNINGETLYNEKLRQAVSDVREEMDVEH